MIEDSPEVLLESNKSSLFSSFDEDEQEFCTPEGYISGCILGRWTDEMEVLTGVERARDIKLAYKALVETIHNRSDITLASFYTSGGLIALIPACGTPDDQCSQWRSNQK